MNGWAFILLVWLQGASVPQFDVSLWFDGDLTECQEAKEAFKPVYKVGAPHPLFKVTVTGFKMFCLRLPRPVEEEAT